MQEIWKDIVGYEGLYQVSNLGNVKSFKKDKNGILLKPGKNTSGYLYVILYKNINKKCITIHRLVMLAFKKNIFNKLEINHINGIKTDNTVENLEWCTCSENIKHAYKIGLKTAKGENHNRSKLTNEQVIAIRNDNRVQHIIAKDYNVSKATIWHIKHKKLWNHI